MTGSLKVAIRGIEMQLLPDRAIFLPHTRELLIADMHCGKAAAFRVQGIPIPEGNTEADLARLSALMSRTAAVRLTILGDWIHAPSGCTEAMVRTVSRWRSAHSRVEMRWIRGNHDRGARELSARLGFEDIPSFIEEPPLRLQHIPSIHPGVFTLAGHTHPVFLLPKDGSRGRIRLPCFHFTPEVATLPAFGSFTGGRRIEAAPDDRVFLTTGEEVIEWLGRR